MRRPTVGITAGEETITSGEWTEPSILVTAAYVRAVQRAGGRALALAPDAVDAEDPGEVLDLVDALLVTGAAGDLDPAAYGATAHPATQPVGGVRDAYELALVRAARRGRLPVLGVCRGMQLLNVAYGGTLEQHLADVLPRDPHRARPGTYAEHGVRLAPGSLAARAARSERARVRSYHHQGVAELGAGLRASAWAEEDRIVEAVEDAEGAWVLGVLWHPEEDEASHVVGALVAAAREHR